VTARIVKGRIERTNLGDVCAMAPQKMWQMTVTVNHWENQDNQKKQAQLEGLNCVVKPC
jgi:hypothetical protein